MAFFTHLVKAEMDENLGSRMDQQSPPVTGHQMPLSGIGMNSQGAMPLAPLPPNSNSLMPLGSQRRLDLDGGLEPLARVRSNTWPAACPEYPDTEEPSDSVNPTDPANPGSLGTVEAAGPPKKNTSRRNPWGNLSYADLIAKAISSSPDNRATLSQVYDWMVQNIAYFKDKGDSNSSAGWKVCVTGELL